MLTDAAWRTGSDRHELANTTKVLWLSSLAQRLVDVAGKFGERFSLMRGDQGSLALRELEGLAEISAGKRASGLVQQLGAELRVDDRRCKQPADAIPAGSLSGGSNGY